MSAKLTDLIFACIERALSRRSPHRLAQVSSYDPTTHSIKGMRQPEGIETGFLAVGSGMAANGYGFALGPNIGDQYVLGFLNGDPEVPFVAGRLFSDEDKPPQVQAGEALMQSQSMAKVFLDQAGNLTISLVGGSQYQMKPDGTVTINSSSGGKMQINPDGSAFAMPASGKLFYLGGDGVSGTYGFVSTTAGNSAIVKAKI